MKVSDKNFMFEKMVLLANNIKKESSVITELLDYPEDAENISKRISGFENRSDEIKHEVGFLLANDDTLISELKFRRMFDFCEVLENLTDIIDELGKSFVRFNISSIRDDYAVSLIDVEKSAELIVNLVNSVRREERDFITEIIELNHIKDENSNYYDAQIKRLFSGNEDVLEVLRWKEIYTQTMNVFEAFEDVADMAQRFLFLSGK